MFLGCTFCLDQGFLAAVQEMPSLSLTNEPMKYGVRLVKLQGKLVLLVLDYTPKVKFN